MAICGYLDKWAYRPGDNASLHVDSDDQAYSVDLISIDSPQDASANIGHVGQFPGSRQRSTVGSMIYVPSTGPEVLTRASIRLWIWPTLPERGTQQVLLSWRDQATDEGLTLAIDSDGRLYGRASIANVEWKTSLSSAVRARTWYHIFVGLDAAAGRLAVLSSERDGRVLDRSVTTHRASDEATSIRIDGPITIGAIGSVDNAGKYAIDQCYDGKIEQPAVYREWPESQSEKAWQSFDFPAEAVVGRWDLAQVHGTTKVPDSEAGERHGSTINLPALRMKGHGWSWRQSPAEQALNRNAIHFHHDDVGDRQWDVSTIVQLPEDLEPGAYAVRIDDGSNFAELPFFIRGRDADRPEIAVLLPTFTYLAYGNQRPEMNPEAMAIEKAHRDLGLNAYDESNAIDTFIAQRPDLGASLYNRHADGSGVCYATRLRPVMTFSSDYHWWGTGGPRHLSTDILLLRWLRREGHRFDIVTDEDVDTHGAGLLASYKVVITGSHPEYVSAKWLSALEDWLSGEGRLMYLGGNGLFWVTATTPDMPGVVEIRRGWAGSRDWGSEPGEEWLSLEDGVGGLWRHRGIPPQRLVGVGFTAMGWGSSAGYARCAESFDADVAFVFEGIGDDEIIGGFDSGLGSALTGAAGDEIDRADFSLGTPLETKVLATSSGRHGRFQRSIEELAQFSHHFGSAQDPDVRADMVLIDRQNGGCVFSVGSMNWIPFLAAGDGDNNVATVTRNVLNNFLSRPEKKEG